MRMVAVASPDYFSRHPPPSSPKQLSEHRCINLRMATYGGFYAWEFEREGQTFNTRVKGQCVFDDSDLSLRAAVDGFGIAFLLEDLVKPHLASGELVEVLNDWSSPFDGLYLYYPNRRQHSQVFTLLLDALRL